MGMTPVRPTFASNWSEGSTDWVADRDIDGAQPIYIFSPNFFSMPISMVSLNSYFAVYIRGVFLICSAIHS